MFSLLSQDIQNIIVFDLEWNQSGYNPNHRMPHEIIEIGACRVDRAGNVVSRFSELIRPRVYKRLDKHIKQVTGITEQELAQGALVFGCLRRFYRVVRRGCAACDVGAGRLSRAQAQRRVFYDPDAVCAADRRAARLRLLLPRRGTQADEPARGDGADERQIGCGGAPRGERRGMYGGAAARCGSGGDGARARAAHAA